MLFNQFFYAYCVIRQHEYSYHHESESSISVVFVVSIRLFESRSINQSSQTSRDEDQYARSSSLSQILVSASTLRNLTSYVSTSIISLITENFFKKLSQFDKIYTNDEKFKSTDDNFDFKLRIFFNKCKRVELSSYVYMKKMSFMFEKCALFHFYDNQYENITFDKFRVDMKKFFKESK
jgi:hypothetical protein